MPIDLTTLAAEVRLVKYLDLDQTAIAADINEPRLDADRDVNHRDSRCN